MLVIIVQSYVLLGVKWPSPPYPNLVYANLCDGNEYYAVEASLSDWEEISVSNPPRFYSFEYAYQKVHIEFFGTYASNET